MTARIREGELLLPDAEHRRTSVLLFPAVKGLEKANERKKQTNKLKKNTASSGSRSKFTMSTRVEASRSAGTGSSEIFINLPKTGLRDWLSAGETQTPQSYRPGSYRPGSCIKELNERSKPLNLRYRFSLS